MSDPVVLLSTGDVVGPAGGVTDNSMVLFSGTSGKLVKGNNAIVTPAGLALLDDVDANAQLTTLGLTTTQPQFDNSVKQATTAFVQRALGNTRGSTAGTANRALTVSDIGAVVLVNPGVTLTLPLANSVPVGSVIHFRTSGGGADRTVAASGSETIYLGNGGGPLVGMKDGDTLSLMSNGINTWINIGGVAGLGNTAQFGASIDTYGYQKLPSGWIIQWGVLADASWVASNFRTINYVMAFPNGVFQSVATMSNSAGTMGRLNTNQLSNSQLQLAVDYTGAATVRWIAIGY